MPAWGHLKQHHLYSYSINFIKLFCGEGPFFLLVVTKTISTRIKCAYVVEQNAEFLGKAQKNRGMSCFCSHKKGGKFEKP